MTMPASKFELPVENPSALIRSRIREKRIFEARFLSRQLGAEIGDREKAALERELAGLLAQVKTLQQQAKEYTALGQNNRAEALYLDIEQIAIDVPGLAEEKKTLAGDALVASITGKGGGRNPEVVSRAVVSAPPDDAARSIDNEPRAVAPPRAYKAALLIAAVRDQLQRLPRLWLLAGIFGLVLILLFLFRGGPEEKSLSSIPKPSQIQPMQKTSSKPLVPVPPAIADHPDKEAEQSATTVEAEPLPSSSLKVGELQVKESARD
jgi:hypothetical protein